MEQQKEQQQFTPQTPWSKIVVPSKESVNVLVNSTGWNVFILFLEEQEKNFVASLRNISTPKEHIDWIRGQLDSIGQIKQFKEHVLKLG